MKLLTSAFFLLIVLINFSACSNKTVIIESSETITHTEQTQNEEVDTPPPPVFVEQQTVIGKFGSVAGVKDELSCYCANGGYVTSEDGTVTAVCFDEPVASCDKIKVSGYMTSKKIESNGDCSAGIMGFLKAQAYICLLYTSDAADD